MSDEKGKISWARIRKRSPETLTPHGLAAETLIFENGAMGELRRLYRIRHQLSRGLLPSNSDDVQGEERLYDPEVQEVGVEDRSRNRVKRSSTAIGSP